MSSLSNLGKVRSDVEQSGIPTNLFVSSCLVDMNAKCGELEDARQVFHSMNSKDVVSCGWTALIAGYAQQGLGQEVLVVYGQMEEAGLVLDNEKIVKRGLLDDLLVGNCLVDIAGYGACDEGHKALACFKEMLGARVHPNDVTFTCLLVACSHEGLVQEGRKLFDSMAEQHGIKPTIEHFNCMIDLVGRAGQLDEAEKMLLSYAGRWTDVDRIETQRRAAGANKETCSGDH